MYNICMEKMDETSTRETIFLCGQSILICRRCYAVQRLRLCRGTVTNWLMFRRCGFYLHLGG